MAEFDFKIDIDDKDEANKLGGLDLKDFTTDEEKKIYGNLTQKLPSQRNARYIAIRNSPRVQMNLTGVPSIIRDWIKELSIEKGITQKELIFHALNETYGFDIPDNLDRRKSIFLDE